MKKRTAAMLLAVCLVFSLAACAAGGNGEQPSQPRETQAQAPSAPKSSETSPQENKPEETGSPETSLPPQESGGETTSEEDISQAAELYELSAEEFVALKAALQAHIDSEWDAEEAYIGADSAYDLAWTCSEIRDNISENFMDNETLEGFIGNDIDGSKPLLTALWQKRATVLAHAVNDWAAQQNVDYDKYSRLWDKLGDYVIVYYMGGDDTYVAPLFDLGKA